MVKQGFTTLSQPADRRRTATSEHDQWIPQNYPASFTVYGHPLSMDGSRGTVFSASLEYYKRYLRLAFLDRYSADEGLPLEPKPIFCSLASA